MSLIEKIDKAIKRLEKEQENAQDDPDQYSGCCNWINGVLEAKEIILSEQKEPCEHDGCVGCMHEEKNNDEYPCNHCKQCYIDQWKPKRKLTIGDKIRESNESLALQLAKLNYAFNHPTTDDIKIRKYNQEQWTNYLNQPYKTD